MKQYLEIGKIVSTQGIKGEVRVQPWCDTPEFLTDFVELYLGKDYKVIEIEYGRQAKNIVILKIKGIDSVEQATTLRNKILYINRDDVELDEDCYFVQDLIGLEVIDVDSNKIYGILFDVSETGANDVYHIKIEDGRELLIPAIPEVVIITDLENNKMLIRPLEGLFEDEN